MSNERKHHTPQEKMTVLRRHLAEKVPASSLCPEYKLHPTVFCRWLKPFFDNGAAAVSVLVAWSPLRRVGGQSSPLHEQVDLF